MLIWFIAFIMIKLVIGCQLGFEPKESEKSSLKLVPAGAASIRLGERLLMTMLNVATAADAFATVPMEVLAVTVYWPALAIPMLGRVRLAVVAPTMGMPFLSHW